MTAQETGKSQEEATGKEEPAGQQGCMDMCRQMMGGGMPSCCGPETKGMMAQWMREFWRKERK